jgi:hypothetical protein
LPFRGRIEDIENGYAMTLPAGWIRIPLDDSERPAMYAALPDEPDLDTVLTAYEEVIVQMRDLGAAFLAIDGVDYATNANVLTTPTFGASLDDIDGLSPRQLKTWLGVDAKVSKSREMLPAGETIFLTYTVNNGPGIPRARVHQFLFADEQRMYAVSVAGLVRDDALLPTARSFAESFEILD